MKYYYPPVANCSVNKCHVRGASSTVLSPGVVLDCCHGHARGNAAWVGGITPFVTGITPGKRACIIKRVTFRHMARIFPRGEVGKGRASFDLRGPR